VTADQAIRFDALCSSLEVQAAAALRGVDVAVAAIDAMLIETKTELETRLANGSDTSLLTVDLVILLTERSATT